MGVVHLARRARTAAGSRSRCCARTSSATTRPGPGWPARSARCSGSRSQRVAEIVDADPWGRRPYVATRYVPGLSLHDLRAARRGRSPARTCAWLAARPGRGASPRCTPSACCTATSSRPTCCIEGRDADPHRLRAGPGGRRPEADPHRLAARHARLPGARDPATATTRRRPPTCTRGRRRSPSRRPGRPPFGRGPSMAIMDRVRRGEHDLTGLPGRRCARSCRRPRPRAGPPAGARRHPRLAAAPGSDGPPTVAPCRRAADKLDDAARLAARTAPDDRPTGAVPAGPTTGVDGASCSPSTDGRCQRDPSARTGARPSPARRRPSQRPPPRPPSEPRRAGLLVRRSALARGRRCVAPSPWIRLGGPAASRCWLLAHRLARRQRGRRAGAGCRSARKWYDAARWSCFALPGTLVRRCLAR